jgi:hypothetical protein
MQQRCPPAARVRTKVAAFNRAQPQQAYSILTDFSPARYFSPALPIRKICRAGARYLRGLPLSIEPRSHTWSHTSPQQPQMRLAMQSSGIVFGMMVGSSCGQL